MNSLEEQLETWRPIVGFEGRYEVSDEGRVRSLIRGMIMKQSLDRNGYSRMTLGIENKNVRIHSLVAESFIGARPELHDVNHKNGVKHDNRLPNLEYVTESQNTKHSFDNGLQDPIVGSDHYAAILDERKVKVILELFDLGIRAREIAELFSIKPKHATKIKSRTIWKHVNH